MVLPLMPEFITPQDGGPEAGLRTQWGQTLA
jgi:hypothetical protein